MSEDTTIRLKVHFHISVADDYFQRARRVGKILNTVVEEDCLDCFTRLRAAWGQNDLSVKLVTLQQHSFNSSLDCVMDFSQAVLDLRLRVRGHGYNPGMTGLEFVRTRLSEWCELNLSWPPYGYQPTFVSVAPVHAV